MVLGDQPRHLLRELPDEVMEGGRRREPDLCWERQGGHLVTEVKAERFEIANRLRGNRGERQPAEVPEAEEVFGLRSARLTEEIGAQEIALSGRLHDALNTTAPPPLLDKPHKPNSFELTDVVIQELTRQPQALGQRAG